MVRWQHASGSLTANMQHVNSYLTRWQRVNSHLTRCQNVNPHLTRWQHVKLLSQTCQLLSLVSPPPPLALRLSPPPPLHILLLLLSASGFAILDHLGLHRIAGPGDPHIVSASVPHPIPMDFAPRAGVRLPLGCLTPLALASLASIRSCFSLPPFILPCFLIPTLLPSLHPPLPVIPTLNRLLRKLVSLNFPVPRPHMVLISWLQGGDGSASAARVGTRAHFGR